MLGDLKKSMDFSAKVIGTGTDVQVDGEAKNPDLHVKALSRSAQCALKMKDLDISKGYVQRALALDPKCGPARACYKELQAAYKAYNAEQKKNMAAAFAKA